MLWQAGVRAGSKMVREAKLKADPEARSIIRASSWGSACFTNTLPPSFLVGWTLSLLLPATNSYNRELLPPPPIIINENPERTRDRPEGAQHSLQSSMGLLLLPGLIWATCIMGLTP